MINVLASVEEDPLENEGGDPMAATQAQIDPALHATTNNLGGTTTTHKKEKLDDYT